MVATWFLTALFTNRQALAGLAGRRNNHHEQEKVRSSKMEKAEAENLWMSWTW